MTEPQAAIAIQPAALVSPFDDPECAYLAMPDGMQTFRAPCLQDDWQGEEAAAGRALLQQIAASLAGGQPQGQWPLQALDADSRRFIGEVLGRGEISIRIAAPPLRLEVEESVFAGLWQIRRIEDGGAPEDYLEAGPLPLAVYQWAKRLADGAAPAMPAAFAEGVMNAPAVLAEIADKSQNYCPGRESILNLSLLPMTPEDVALVADSLGLAGLSLVSKGYGDCRIHLTRVPNVWWVQYFNSPGQMILNTLEITAMPSVALAAGEDLADSAQRLAETLAQLNP